MTGLYKEKLIYNNSLGVDGDNVAAWTVDGYGNPIGSTGNSLNVTMTTGANNNPFDTNYGTVDGYTLRTASQIGNATGGADFNAGATTAQTLRVAANTYDGYGNPISSVDGALTVSLVNGLGMNLDTNYGTVGSTTLRTASEIGNATGAANFNYGTVGAQTLRVAAQLGNATGAADFNTGATDAQTLRTSSNLSDGYGNQLSSTSGSLNVYLTDDRNYGTVGANTLRTASQIGNATGAADFNKGATTAQTLRTTSNLSDGYGNQISSLNGALSVSLTAPNGTAYDTNYGTVDGYTLRTASQIGNATGAADFNHGATTAQTLRTTSNLSDGYGNQINSTNGSLNVTVTNSGASDGVYAEGSGFVAGDLGEFILAVRRDTLSTATTATAQFAELSTNNRGALWTVPTGTVADGVADTENPVKVGTLSVAAPLAGSTAGNRSNMISDLYRRLYVNDNPNVAVNSQAVTVGTSAVALPTTALAGRMRLVIQNLGTKSIYVGPSAVTVNSGMQINAGAALAVEVGDSVVLYGISATAGNNIRVFEMA